MLKSKQLAGLLAAALALSLVSCAPASSGSSSSSGAAGSSTASSSEEQSSQEEESLSALMDDIAAQVQPGTAGSSLKAVPFAGALLDWCLTTTLTADQAEAAVLAWQAEQSDDVKANLPEQMQLVSETCTSLRSDTGADLMSDAGYENGNAPWSAVPADVLDAILSAIPA